MELLIRWQQSGLLSGLHVEPLVSQLVGHLRAATAAIEVRPRFQVAS